MACCHAESELFVMSRVTGSENYPVSPGQCQDTVRGIRSWPFWEEINCQLHDSAGLPAAQGYPLSRPAHDTVCRRFHLRQESADRPVIRM